MAALRESLGRARDDTLSFFGWTPKLLIWPVLFGIGWLFHGQWAKDMGGPNEELFLWATYTLAPICAFAPLLFLWNLICAPYRMERDRRIALEASIPKMTASDRIKTQQTFPLWEAACLLAGTPVQKNPIGEASAYLHQIKSIMVRDNLTRPGKVRRSYKPRTGKAPTADQFLARRLSREQEIEEISDYNEISRDELRLIALELQRSIPGLTDKPFKDLIPFVSIRNIANNDGWILNETDSAVANRAYALEGKLRQAAVDGELRVWGRKYDVPMSNAPLLQIPREHFEEYGIAHGALHYQVDNKTSRTGKIDTNLDQSRGLIYCDLHVSKHEIERLLKAWKPTDGLTG